MNNLSQGITKHFCSLDEHFPASCFTLCMLHAPRGVWVLGQQLASLTVLPKPLKPMLEWEQNHLSIPVQFLPESCWPGLPDRMGACILEKSCNNSPWGLGTDHSKKPVSSMLPSVSPRTAPWPACCSSPTCAVSLCLLPVGAFQQ